MQSISANLRDPSWWFTAVVIGVTASVAAGFLKDYIEGRYGLFLAWSRRQSDRRRLSREEALNRWSSDESLLTIAFLRMLYSVVVFTAFGMLYTHFVTFLRLKHDTDSVLNAALSTKQVLTLAIGGISMLWFSFETAERVFRVQSCFRRFRDERGLPRLFSSDDEL